MAPAGSRCQSPGWGTPGCEGLPAGVDGRAPRQLVVAGLAGGHVDLEGGALGHVGVDPEAVPAAAGDAAVDGPGQQLAASGQGPPRRRPDGRLGQRPPPPRPAAMHRQPALGGGQAEAGVAGGDHAARRDQPRRGGGVDPFGVLAVAVGQPDRQGTVGVPAEQQDQAGLRRLCVPAEGDGGHLGGDRPGGRRPGPAVEAEAAQRPRAGHGDQHLAPGREGDRDRLGVQGQLGQLGLTAPVPDQHPAGGPVGDGEQVAAGGHGDRVGQGRVAARRATPAASRPGSRPGAAAGAAGRAPAGTTRRGRSPWPAAGGRRRPAPPPGPRPARRPAGPAAARRRRRSPTAPRSSPGPSRPADRGAGRSGGRSRRSPRATSIGHRDQLVDGRERQAVRGDGMVGAGRQPAAVDDEVQRRHRPQPRHRGQQPAQEGGVANRGAERPALARPRRR